MKQLFVTCMTATGEMPPLTERLSVGAEVAIMGILIVFFVLAIIWGVLELFRVIFYEIPKRRSEKVQAKGDAAVKADAIDAPMAPVSPQEDGAQTEETEGEVLAAITAALAVMLERPPSSFRVVSFRKKQSRRR